MGANASAFEKEINNDQQLSNEHFYGLVNFGNTCYCNSVIQALYFCRPFREKVLQYKAVLKKTGTRNTRKLTIRKPPANQKENLLTCLADLFHNIATQKRRVGSIAPKKFIAKLKREKEEFDNFMQQDAQEFLNYLLNTIAEILTEEAAQQPRLSAPAAMPVHARTGVTTPTVSADGVSLHSTPADTDHRASRVNAVASTSGTWVHQIFQGTLTNETRCLNCESVTSKDEDFLDLPVDIEPNASITHCLRVFSNMETLGGEHKYYCDNCCSKQEAQKRMRIKKLPKILAIHLKRFKVQEQLNRYTKLSNRVLFALELRLFNISEGCENGERLYDLVAVIVHCGSTLNRGHYITVVKSHGHWLVFDDDMVDRIDANDIEEFFGLSNSSTPKNSESAYILFYQAREASNVVEMPYAAQPKTPTTQTQ